MCDGTEIWGSHGGERKGVETFNLKGAERSECERGVDNGGVIEVG